MTEQNTNKPYPTKVREGKRYFICSCKLTKKQPFCDGSHVDTDNQPYMYTAEENKEVYFCGCKKSTNFPFCDGSHNNLNN
ncbi:MAG: CDGSH iron-sulfur domain-containing protein [Alphaproteobacteria bacterium TMED93]|nr:MAG: CDGSH iron-sulfur domain-containing protein [Alphaproteobacteria bacterium TMED93]|tara:strand:+ start:336 stop:575 length:240 start_codon:yes stop_codon:yes gene_type:complete